MARRRQQPLMSHMYEKNQRDAFYQAYIRILRRAPDALQGQWDEAVSWVEGADKPYLHVNVSLLPEPLKDELKALLRSLAAGEL